MNIQFFNGFGMKVAEKIEFESRIVLKRYTWGNSEVYKILLKKIDTFPRPNESEFSVGALHLINVLVD